ncbi:MAG: xanthan lyase, partial [Bacteroidales bacterium]|nr:xanthan lyase [Bacteroidales bacterium]
RRARCTRNGGARARWTPAPGRAGRYAVYVSYKSTPESCACARYTVCHRGGKTRLSVDQRRAGGTWVFLGFFELDDRSYVELDNRGESHETVSADAVKFGGGYGKILRGGRLSGMPAWAEGASCWMPWAGLDSCLRNPEKNDYFNDYAMRPEWVALLKREKGIPFDCSLAFHTDAGTAAADTTVGTLAIYSLFNEQTRKFSDGSDRMASRLLADFVQSQIVSDVRAGYNPQWTRRELWDRGYREVLGNDVPAMLLELLSHQNLADMTCGQDPAFRFAVCRAIYKGILKFLSAVYGCPYRVQPLPVQDFALRFSADSSRALLQWTPVQDPLEPTAAPQAYLVRTRVDDGVFDEGVRVEKPCWEYPVSPGHIYAFQVSPLNDGGMGFPSEILAIGRPGGPEKGQVLVVNNFDRVSAPAWKDDGEQIGGFAAWMDSGVPYLQEYGYIGENYEFRREMEWKSDDDPGFGASHRPYAGGCYAGNSFDYPYVHGRALMALGYGFRSMSRNAFCADTTCRETLLDLICGKQLTVCGGAGSPEERHAVFPPALQAALRNWTRRGGGIFLSGCNIATDGWIRIFPIEEKPGQQVRDFIGETFGYRFDAAYGTAAGCLAGYAFYHEPNTACYRIEAADALASARKGARIWLRYPDSGKGGAVLYEADGHRSAAIGVPLECFREEKDRREILAAALAFLTGS